MVDGVLKRACAAALAEDRARGPMDAHTQHMHGGQQGGQQGVGQGGGSLGGGASASSHETHIARLASASPLHLHRLVAHFVATRWPTAVALNKADHPAAAEALRVAELEALATDHTIAHIQLQLENALVEQVKARALVKSKR